MEPEHWSCYLLGLIVPFIVILSIIQGSWWMAAGLILFLVVGPILDILSGEVAEPRPAPESNAMLVMIPYLHCLMVPIVLVVLLWRTYLDGPDMMIILGTLSAGIVAGASGIVASHELGHRRPGSAGYRLSRFTLFLCNYTHFTVEHNHNHHYDVATDKDAASAPFNRGLYTHLVITIPQQFLSAVRTDLGKRWNRALQGLVLQIIAVTAVGLLLGWYIAVVWLGFSAVSIFMLEYVNYIQHHGLRREVGEKQTHMHSWQSEARWSRWTLLELPRHPAHHLKASTPYWQLQPYEGAPTLPIGYYGCFWPCTIPPLWKRWMRKRIPESMRQT